MNLKSRIFGLDLMRAMAIAMVVCSHALYIFQGYNNTLINAVQVFGVQGVEVFFVLSGFLIGGILLRLLEKTEFSKKEMLHFWIRRWFRTLPLYYLILVVNIIVALFIGFKLPETIWKYFLFLQNFSDYHIPFFPESWSLSVEEFAYLLAPFCIFIFYRMLNKSSINKEKFFLRVSVFLSIIFLGSKVYYYLKTVNDIQSLELWNSNLKAIVIYRLDAIFYGFILVYYFNERKTVIEIHRKNLFVVGLFLWFFVLVVLPLIGMRIEAYPFYWNVLYLPLNSIAISLMLPFLYYLKPPKKVISNFIQRVSLYSYAMYLLHYTFILYIMQLLLDFQSMNLFQRIACLILYLLLTYFLSKGIYLFFERPITNLRDSKCIKSFLKN